jgi:hypothetical protein
MTQIKVGPSKLKKVGLATGSAIWLLAAVFDFFVHLSYIYAFQVIGIIVFLMFGGVFANRHPIEIDFFVGTRELHRVKYVYLETIKETQIFVDAHLEVKLDRFWHSPRREEFALSIGKAELHEILIRRRRSYFALFSGTTSFDILVDDLPLTLEQVKLTQRPH